MSARGPMPSPGAELGRRLPILRGSGTGRTALAAFHEALRAVNCAHFNLVRLSSVVPVGTHIDAADGSVAPVGSWGDRLFCVFAEQRATEPGQQAWAGVGWVERVDKDGGGLLVEHEGDDEAAVTQSIVNSLSDMVSKSGGAFSPPQFLVNGVTCTDEPVCSLVIAPFAVVPWTRE